MSPKVVQRIALVLVLSVGLWLALRVIGTRARDDAGRLSLPSLTPGDVDKITLVGAGDTVRLARQGDRWQANGFPASLQAVKEFLAAAGDSSAESELIAQSASSHARLGVDSVTGRRVAIEGGGKPLLDLVVGNRGPDFNGFYVRRSGELAVYLLRGRFAELLVPGQDQWRDRQVASIPADSIARIDVVRGKSRWSLNRAGKAWTVGAVPADSAKVARLLAQFGDIRATGFPDRAELDSLDFMAPERSLTLSDAAGQPLLALVFDSTASGAFWIRPVAGGPVYRLDGRTTELMTPLSSALTR